MSESKTILIIDGHNLIRRTFEAIQIDEEEKKIEATIKSSIASIGAQIKKHCPHYFMMALDYGGKTFRHDIYPGYKENRTPIPEKLSLAITDLSRTLNDSGLYTIAVPGVEAEDVIATISKKSIKRQMKTIVISNDKDLACLSADGIEVWDKTTERNEQFIQDKFKVFPYQMPDFLALMGDSTDGIPGLPGVGATTAAKLLAQFDSLERIIEVSQNSPEKIPGKLGEKIKSNLVLAILSKQLTRLKDDVDIVIRPSEIKIPDELRVSLLEFDQKLQITEKSATLSPTASMRR